jgi:hypothetical protein
VVGVLRAAVVGVLRAAVVGVLRAGARAGAGAVAAGPPDAAIR